MDAKAQQWAEYLAKTGSFQHSPDTNPPIGENIAMSWASYSQKNNGALVKEAVNNWYNEVSQYSYSNPGFGMNTGHFTQVVWKSSKYLGLGLAVKGNSVYIVGNYSPPGNFQGDFKANVKKPV